MQCTEAKRTTEWEYTDVLLLYVFCENHRTITLLKNSYNILVSLINKRLKQPADKIIGYYQNGFRPCKSIVKAIHMLEQIIQQRRSSHKGFIIGQ